MPRDHRIQVGADWMDGMLVGKAARMADWRFRKEQREFKKLCARLQSRNRRLAIYGAGGQQLEALRRYSRESARRARLRHPERVRENGRRWRERNHERCRQLELARRERNFAKRAAEFDPVQNPASEEEARRAYETGVQEDREASPGAAISDLDDLDSTKCPSCGSVLPRPIPFGQAGWLEAL